jgi:hypothetical protein
MLSSQLDQADRKEVLENDKRVRGSTFLDHTTNDTGGRFAQVGAAHVVGSTATPNYPQASAPFQCDPVPDEPPLGFDNPALNPSDLEPSSSAAQAPDPTSNAPSLTPLSDGQRTDVGSLSNKRVYRRF